MICHGIEAEQANRLRLLLQGDGVHLGRHDEVILVQSAYLAGMEVDGTVTPAESDVAVVAFSLANRPDFAFKGQRSREIIEVGVVSPNRRKFRQVSTLFFAGSKRENIPLPWSCDFGLVMETPLVDVSV